MESSNVSTSSAATLYNRPSIVNISPSPVLQASKVESASSGTLKECMLISGWVAMSAQLVLLAVVITALTIKRHRERPKRPWIIWLLDILKQACSGAAGHTVGMIVAMVAHRASQGASECGWYFVVYFADCSLGITLAISFHKLTNILARHYSQKGRDNWGSTDYEKPWWDALVEIGNYGDPPSYRKWAIQVCFWVINVVTARLIVGLVIYINIPALQQLTLSLDQRFQGRPGTYLFTVMVGIPVFINIGQAWIQDQVLKWRIRKHHPSSKAELSVSMVPGQEPEAVALTLQMDGSTLSGLRKEK
ncbi:hypothetical protein CEUSTIGMA_g10593.t1 [Chlamydomonas eustigma]|uniref:Uncharacterized protein n=1 Tax=Chlamydomonas eustigma TaxID=1157962 RepID=A0A250XJB7_9CHLO|nr:hypothetical protein CEUSTIGMA_g10593.t1 [Chlamydomonas eustigma]|eukprot:GAX83167.1 hypothetical protein CEUSTIGMA_g10593.t1 [Chlamydomonas eustigma]